MELQEARSKIDALDGQMAGLFEERMALAAEIARYKKENGLPVFDAQREAAVTEKNAARISQPELRSH